MTVNQQEILRYLGYNESTPDAAVSARIKEVTAELEACVNPVNVYKYYACVVSYDTVVIENVVINSKNLARRLEGCEKAVLFAVTLGSQADTLIRRYTVADISKAAVAQAVCAAMCEDCCNKLQQQILQEAKQDKLNLKPRFSPGYGDFSITHQRDFMRLLDCGKKIGLSITDDYMMIPTKSVTAVVGLY